MILGDRLRLVECFPSRCFMILLTTNVTKNTKPFRCADGFIHLVFSGLSCFCYAPDSRCSLPYGGAQKHLRKATSWLKIYAEIRFIFLYIRNVVANPRQRGRIYSSSGIVEEPNWFFDIFSGCLHCQTFNEHQRWTRGF